MATPAEVFARTYAAGDTVERSGIYRVEHARDHVRPYEVTVTYGARFPSCRMCDRSSFHAERLAQHVENHQDFRSSTSFDS